MLMRAGVLCKSGFGNYNPVQSASSWTQWTAKPYINRTIRVVGVVLNISLGLSIAGIALGLTRRFTPDVNVKKTPDISVILKSNPKLKNKKGFAASGYNYDDKHIVTVNHIASGSPPDSIIARAKKGSFIARKVGTDKGNDIAVYRMEENRIRFEKSFLDIPDRNYGKKWSISFLESNVVVGGNCHDINGKKRVEIKKACNFCFVSLVSPKKYRCIGWINTKPGYSGSPVFVENKSECKAVGIHQASKKSIFTNIPYQAVYIRTSKIHEVVQSIIKSAEKN